MTIWLREFYSFFAASSSYVIALRCKHNLDSRDPRAVRRENGSCATKHHLPNVWARSAHSGGELQVSRFAAARLADCGAVSGSTDGYLQCLFRVKSRREHDQLATSGAALVADINLTASDFCYGSVAEVRVFATDMVDLWLMSKKEDLEMRGKKMRRLLASALLASTMVAGPAYAALKPGDKAPAFKAHASLGGKEFTFPWLKP